MTDPVGTADVRRSGKGSLGAVAPVLRQLGRCVGIATTDSAGAVTKYDSRGHGGDSSAHIQRWLIVFRKDRLNPLARAQHSRRRQARRGIPSSPPISINPEWFPAACR